MTMTIADGQVAAAATAILTGGVANAPQRITASFHNTSASLTETLVLTYTRNGGAARRVGRAVLAPNESAILSGFPLEVGDVLLAASSDANVVDYLISGEGSNPIPQSWASFDANGALKQSGTGTVASPTFTNVSLTGLLTLSKSDSLTAVGTTQGGALALVSEVNRITTAANATSPYNGVALELASAGLDIMVINDQANPIQVYGQGTDTVNDVATATGVTQPPFSVVLYVCSTSAAAGKYYAEGTGGGFTGSLATLFTVGGLTALGGGQGGALLLPAMVNRITTCGAGNGVILQPNVVGMTQVVTNDGANALTIYPDTGAAINSLPTNTGTLLPVGATATFYCEAANVWKTSVFPPREVNTAITTVGAGTLTAAALVGGVITRSGSVAAYSDTVDTAANIIAAVHGAAVGQSWEVTIRNTVAFAETILTAAGVTLSGQVIIPPNSVGRFLVSIASATTVTIQGLGLMAMSPPPPEANTAITTVGAGTLTAAAIVGGVITRSGSVAAYSDTVDNASNIIAALPNGSVGQSFELTIKNTVAFAETILTATGITLSGQVVIPPLSVGRFLVSVATATTVTIQGLGMMPMTTPPIVAQGTLTTVGAGTILAATIAGGLLLRTGSTAAFTDTTDTGTLIAGAIPNVQIGESFLWTYQNSTYATATLTGGVGVNAAATFATVGPGAWVTVLFTCTAANTFSTAVVNAGANFGSLPPYQLVTNTTTGTFAAGQLTGAQFNCYTSTQTTPGSIATRTATQMFGDVPGAFVGMSFVSRIINSTSAANSMTITAGGGVTLTGKTSYVATQYGFMDFLITFTSSTTATMQFIGAGVGTTQ